MIGHRRPYRTENQREVMGVILKAAEQGRTLTRKELHAALPTLVMSYDNLRKVIQLLEEGGMLVREKQGRDVYIIPTMRGFDWFRPLR